MSKEARKSEEKNDDTGISKRWQSSQTEATLFDQNPLESTSLNESDPIYESEDANQLSKTEETVSKSCKESCMKSSKEKKVKPSSTRSGCSKYCTGYKRDVDNQSYKVTVCTSRKKDILGYRLKRSKRKLQQISNQVKKRTKQSVKKIKKMYENFNAKRAAGFTCDLRKCESTLLDCSASKCVKPNMLFNTLHKLKDKITRDREDTYTICYSKSSRVGTENNDLKVLKEKSTGTSVEEETSM